MCSKRDTYTHTCTHTCINTNMHTHIGNRFSDATPSDFWRVDSRLLCLPLLGSWACAQERGGRRPRGAKQRRAEAQKGKTEEGALLILRSSRICYHHSRSSRTAAPILNYGPAPYVCIYVCMYICMYVYVSPGQQLPS